MRRFRLSALLAVVALSFALVPALQSHACAHALDWEACFESLEEAAGIAAPAAPLPGEAIADNFELVGHTPLNNRGMNAAIAKHGDYVYVGSRTDGQPHHLTPGILVVDVSNPATPTVVHEIGAPNAAAIGETSRELRIWPEAELLVVLNFSCSEILHACVNGQQVSNKSRVTFFDISGANAAAPKLVSTYTPSAVPHEFFLWVDPAQPEDRALMFWTRPSTSRTAPNLVVTDISRAKHGDFSEQRWIADFPAKALPSGETEDRRLHSFGLSNDGTRAYLAFLGAGFLVLDTSEIVEGVENPTVSLVTPPQNRVAWANPGAHSAVKLWNSETVLVTDEVYGDALDPVTNQDHGCPWGWARFLDISDPSAPTLLSEYKVAENDPSYCEDPQGGGNPLDTTFTSYSAHNPTFTPSLAFITWHSAGLEAVDITNPAAPTHAGRFKPESLPAVVTEDPALSSGLDRVVMWSYPIISDGLIYVLDVRNGLYVLRYTGPHAAEVDAVEFLEGNSNLGDALRFDPA